MTIIFSVKETHKIHMLGYLEVYESNGFKGIMSQMKSLLTEIDRQANGQS